MNLQLYIKEVRKSGKRSFTMKDVLEHYQVSANHARVALYRLLKSGDIISPARGLYVIVPPERQSYGSIAAEELVPILMEYINADYYVALLSAGLFHGATHQKPAKFQVISNKKHKHSLSFDKVEIDLIYKKSLLDLPLQNFVVSTGYLKIATPELITLDLLSYAKKSGGLNHISTVLSELIESIEPDKLITLAKKLGLEYQLQRVGYILERIDVMNDKKKDLAIKKLADFVTSNATNYIPLASEITKVSHPRCKKWKIIENTNIESDL